jgi:alkylation response protein AidB-like acyl-CoA dehydrogenase
MVGGEPGKRRTILSVSLAPAVLPASSEVLRAEVRQFLSEELAAKRFVPGCDKWLGGFDLEFSKRLGDQGWLGMTWPQAYGGHGRSALDRYVVTEELLAAGAPVAAHWVGDRQSGPSLLRYGTEAQKLDYLPRMASGDHFFAIGMSEPGSGSDLASVRTRADRIDGGWRINGRKIWCSSAHRVDSFILLCRSEPPTEDRHAGLTQFVVDLRAPGITIRPIHLLSGEHHFNEVIMDNVEISDDCLLGEVGSGWAQVTSELAYERSGPERFLSTFPALVALLQRLGKAADRGQKVAIGRLAAQLRALRGMSVSVASALDRGDAPNVEAALVKDLGTRFEGDLVEQIRLLVETEPEYGAEDELNRLLAESFLHMPGFTLRGGTNEILRGVVARGLGLR